MNENGTELIKVARVKGAFGVKGEVRVISFTETPEDALGFGPLLSEGGAVVLSPKRHRAVKDGFAVKCDEVSTPEQADTLRGTELFTSAANLPEPEGD